MISASVTRTLVTREDMDPELIQRTDPHPVSKTALIWSFGFALASAIQKPDTGHGLSIPLHDGASRYYNRDQPSFLQENAEPIALIITIAAMLFSGLLALRARLTSGQKNRMDSYNFMLLEIADRARSSNSSGELMEMKNELYGILETVVRALDTR